MLDFLKSRNERHGITVYLIFGCIILVFAFWGVKTVDGPSAGFAAEVNHEIVSIGEFKRAFDRQMQFYGQFMGGQFTPKGEQLARMKEGVLDSLIGTKLISQAAEIAGFRTTDNEVRDQILSIPAFQQSGQFDRNAYKGFLEQSRISTSEFENSLRDSARMSLARGVIGQVFKPSSTEVQKLYVVQNTKVDLEFLTLDSATVPKPRANEVENFLADTAQVAKIQDFYNKNTTKFSKGEQIRAQHILIKDVPGKDGAALKKILEISQMKNQDFGELAKKHSEDSGSKDKNGDLGFFERGRMVPEFEKVAFALETNVVSEPVKTNFGYHLIKVLEKKAASTLSFDEVKRDLATETLTADHFSQLNVTLEALVKEQNTNKLKEFVAANKLKWESTGLFETSAATIPKLGEAPDFQDVLSEATKEKPLAPRLVRVGTKTYALKLKDLQLPKSNPDPVALEAVSQQAANARMDEVMDHWRENLNRSSKILKNQSAISQF